MQVRDFLLCITVEIALGLHINRTEAKMIFEYRVGMAWYGVARYGMI